MNNPMLTADQNSAIESITKQVMVVAEMVPGQNTEFVRSLIVLAATIAINHPCKVAVIIEDGRAVEEAQTEVAAALIETSPKAALAEFRDNE